MHFCREIARRNRELGLRLCVGLDTDGEKVQKMLGASDVYAAITTFNGAIIDATRHVACAYKPNLWFYLARGVEGYRALIWTVARICELGFPALLDAKPGDIGNTSEQIAKTVFDAIGADATTVNCYLGGDAIQPILDRAEGGSIVICKTSNPGSAEFQDRLLIVSEEDLQELARGSLQQTQLSILLQFSGVKLWQVVALRVANHWNTNGNCGLVVGSTFPEEARVCREMVGPDVPMLVPALGSQGGELVASVKAAVGSDGQGVALFNVSRAIAGASTGSDFAEAAGKKAEWYHRAITAALAT
ncbi:MAG: orotidine-5'-phosphate decarboxylase [Parcubacteria group bacterium]|nr:orotidine-5'-phosphate decarboxylase [Parcubacteria group bacterium]